MRQEYSVQKIGEGVRGQHRRSQVGKLRQSEKTQDSSGALKTATDQYPPHAKCHGHEKEHRRLPQHHREGFAYGAQVGDNHRQVHRHHAQRHEHGCGLAAALPDDFNQPDREIEDLFYK